MLHTLLLLLAASADLGAAAVAATYRNRSGPANDRVVVTLFEWAWNDVAKECNNLGNWGYWAVQVSPPHEDPANSTEWWARYQPVSYKLHSRGGTAAEFAAMVAECKRHGVEIIADAVINHMANLQEGYGRAGTHIVNKCTYDGGYNCTHFHHTDCEGGDCGACKDCLNCEVLDCPDNGSDPSHMLQCNLLGLPDLNHSHPFVQDSVAGYLSQLVDLGVVGIRVDAAKHIEPKDLDAILSKVKPPGLYVFQESMFFPENCNCTPKAGYYRNGRMYEFHVPQLFWQIFTQDNSMYKILDMNPSDPGSLKPWLCGGWTPSDLAVSLVANHDLLIHDEFRAQAVTMFNEQRYRLALITLLAHPYGQPNILSSINFDPATYEDKAPTQPVFPDGCGYWKDEPMKPYLCEHRWPEVRNMVAWRKVAGLSDILLLNIYNKNSTLVMTRGDRNTTSDQLVQGFSAAGSPSSLGKAFVMVNNGPSMFDQVIDTMMPPGQYCNVVTQDLGYDSCYPCTDSCPDLVTVDVGGRAAVLLGAYQALAFHVNASLPLLEAWAEPLED